MSKHTQQKEHPRLSNNANDRRNAKEWDGQNGGCRLRLVLELKRSAFRGCVSLSLISDFILPAVVAMLQLPHVMRKARAKLDNVVGPDRIPEFHDKKAFRTLMRSETRPCRGGRSLC
ncbi:hypothetical protein EV702DRAFT_569769 [Suillus placidus]|uniref:Uncharacterized protein n=1 Tax=Suillus placidus TaxID=48579 RepID=A0A9P7D0C7_9AGAM|nr:hypothetical protein EV702DRAFT_569769 [Suillus placidus]